MNEVIKVDFTKERIDSENVNNNTLSYVAFDLDGTLAHYEIQEKYDPSHIGKPIERVVKMVKAYLDNDVPVKIMTARVGSGTEKEREKARVRIQNWLEQEASLPRLEVTCHKDYNMVKLYDDRCEQIFVNQGMGYKELLGYIYAPLARWDKQIIRKKIKKVGDSGLEGRALAETMTRFLDLMLR